MNFRLSLNLKFLVSFLLIALVPLSTMAIITYQKSEKALELEIGNRFETIAVHTLEQSEQLIDQIQKNLESWTMIDAMQDMVADDPDGRIFEEIAKLKEGFPENTYIFSTNKEGKILATSHENLLGKNIKTNSWFLKAAQAGDFLIQKLNYSDLIGEYALTFSVPIRAEHAPEEIIGYIFIQYPWENLMKMTNSKSSQQDVEEGHIQIHLMNSGGKVIAGPPNLFNISRDEKTERKVIEFPFLPFHATMRALNGEKGYRLEPDISGLPYLIGYAGIGVQSNRHPLGWIVLVREEAEFAFAPARDLQVKFIQVGVVTAFITLIFSFLIARQIKQPIVSMTDAALEISKGNLDKKIEVKTSDELGNLATAFNQMVTDLKASQENLIQSREKAEAANVAKSEFLARMSHELRTPMNAILGFAQLLEMDFGDKPDSQELTNIKMIIKGGNHLLKLINEVLDLSKIEAGKLKVSLESTNACKLLQEVQELLTPLAQEYQVNLELKLNPEKNYFVLADYFRLKQVILNLVSNGIKYNKPNGQVFLDIIPQADSILRIMVVDTGKGISHDEQATVFEPFQRGSEVDMVTEGTGVGLAICQRLISAMNGTIGFTSEPGQGSSFFIDLPLGKDHAIPVNSSQLLSKPALQNDDSRELLKILYVEDNPENMQLATQILNPHPWIKLITASTGELGIDFAKLHQPNLILLDIHLPGMNGLEVFEELRDSSQTSHIPVWALSADAMPDDVQRALRLGFKDYIIKPLDVKSFKRKLDVFFKERKESPISPE